MCGSATPVRFDRIRGRPAVWCLAASALCLVAGVAALHRGLSLHLIATLIGQGIGFALMYLYLFILFRPWCLFDSQGVEIARSGAARRKVRIPWAHIGRVLLIGAHRRFCWGVRFPRRHPQVGWGFLVSFRGGQMATVCYRPRRGARLQCATIPSDLKDVPAILAEFRRRGVRIMAIGCGAMNQ